MRSRLFLLGCLLAASVGCKGQTNRPWLFRETALPARHSPRANRLNHALPYSVRKRGKRLVTRVGNAQRLECSLTVPAGEFYGYDMGEWGGALRFRASPGSPSVLIKKGNVRLVFTRHGRVYFLEGLAHLGQRAGALYEITGAAPAFAWTKLADLDDAPEAFALVGDDVFIAQSEGFTVLRGLRPEVVVNRTFWDGLYPNSVAVFGDTAYVGLRGGYAQVVLPTKRIRFFRHMPL